MTEKEFAAQWHDNEDFIEANTSGSTGIPKTILLSKKDMRISAKATNDYFGIDAQSRLICPMDYKYVGAKMMYVRAQVASAELVSLKPSNHFDFAGYADLLAIVPSQVDCVIGSPALRRRIRNLIIGGAPLDAARMQKLRLTGINAFTTYGMTETSSHVALSPIGSDVYHSLPSITFSTDCRDCLIIDMSGRDTNRVITNDIVKLISPNQFQWLGRYDNIINSGGIKIHPESISIVIKQALTELRLDHTEVLVYGVSSEKWGQEAHCAIESKRDFSFEELGELRNLLCKKLEDPKYIPRRFHIVSQLDRTPNGKLKKIIY